LSFFIGRRGQSNLYNEKNKPVLGINDPIVSGNHATISMSRAEGSCWLHVTDRSKFGTTVPGLDLGHVAKRTESFNLAGREQVIIRIGNHNVEIQLKGTNPVPYSPPSGAMVFMPAVARLPVSGAFHSPLQEKEVWEWVMHTIKSIQDNNPKSVYVVKTASASGVAVNIRSQNEGMAGALSLTFLNGTPQEFVKGICGFLVATCGLFRPVGIQTINVSIEWRREMNSPGGILLHRAGDPSGHEVVRGLENRLGGLYSREVPEAKIILPFYPNESYTVGIDQITQAFEQIFNALSSNGRPEIANIFRKRRASSKPDS
jgi:hypothetical protein